MFFICPKGQRDQLGEYCTRKASKTSREHGLLKLEQARLSKEASMKNKWIIVAVAGVSFFPADAAAAARSYNPLKWIKKSPSPTASEQLAANQEQQKKLSLQLQAVLPPRTSLKDACAGFKTLNDCVAALHVSHNLTIKFNCLKWDVTGAKPPGDVKSCPAPSNDKPVDLSKAIRALKPDANSHAEARTAEKRAREDIKDAS
jgi:hypothetical protein